MIWASHHAPLARSGRTWPHQQATASHRPRRWTRWTALLVVLLSNHPQIDMMTLPNDTTVVITHGHRRSPNVAVRCHSRMELRPPTARKSHPNFFAHCKRSTKMKKYKKTIIPNVQNTIRTQVTPMVLNYGKLSKNDIF